VSGCVWDITSPAGDQGYPGNLRVTVTYTLTADNFKLSGEGSGSIEGHKLTLNARGYTPVDATLIPADVLDQVADTPMDFTRSTAVGARIRDGFEQLVIGWGYDHNYVLDRHDNSYTTLEPAARVVDPGSGRVLTIATTEPGI
jgi:aldose 1-epimerase